jgi:selenocysteine lyase/cysteine desulfurase
MSELSKYFEKYRNNIVGIDEVIESPYGTMPLVYTDWTASGRLYAPIEHKIKNDFGAFVANTHTKTSYTGSLMTTAYEEARQIIKNHVNASADDILIQAGHGMTGAVNKLQRILGLKIDERYRDQVNILPDEVPVVFVTHMEHHSNQTSWLETIADVEIIPYIDEKHIDFEAFAQLIDKYKNRNLKIASVTACSNVTGVAPDYKRVASMIHAVNGCCFVDFACSAPYVDIDMHPEDESQQLDAIFFSPHKFLGGPGTSGILIFNKKLYQNTIPDQPGGGTVLWTNPWGEHKYYDDPEIREDGGTPGFLQAIRTALSIKLKEEMGTKNIRDREHEILAKLIPAFNSLPNLTLLADKFTNRLGVLSFTIEGLHNNLGVKMLNDRFGIQTRGGCSCAGTYGHILLQVKKEQSHKIAKEIEKGCTENKPGWMRLSIHPTTTDQEVSYIINAVAQLARSHQKWANDYALIEGEFIHKQFDDRKTIEKIVKNWFKI